MADQGSVYYGLKVSTWDLFRPDHENWDDRFLFQDVIRQYGEPALDVGCATGRLILTYMKEGIDVDGVDASAEVLALCRAKAERAGLKPTLYQQRMEHLDLPRTYKTIVVSSSSFQLLTELDAGRDAMDRFYRHLDTGGALVMPFMTLWSEGEPTEMDWELEWEGRLKMTDIGEARKDEDGTPVRIWSRSRYDVETQLEHNEERYEVTLEGKTTTEEHPSSVRSYTQKQALDLYAAAGFEDVRVWKDFTTDPATKDDKLFTVIGVRP
jgi:ubiquinone/menaquinone biosynthesis C-methylase UbiE